MDKEKEAPRKAGKEPADMMTNNSVQKLNFQRIQKIQMVEESRCLSLESTGSSQMVH